MAEEVAEETNSLEQLKRSMQYALIKNCDMNEEMRSDAVDLVISAVEKYQANYELAARMVKDQVRERQRACRGQTDAATSRRRHTPADVRAPWSCFRLAQRSVVASSLTGLPPPASAACSRRWTRSTTRTGS